MAGRDRAIGVMPRKPGRAVAASRCSPAGARTCAHVLAPGCQRCPASRDRRGGCNRRPEPSAAFGVCGHAWLVSLGIASDSGRINRMARNLVCLSYSRPPCAVSAGSPGVAPRTAGAASGVSPI